MVSLSITPCESFLPSPNSKKKTKKKEGEHEMTNPVGLLEKQDVNTFIESANNQLDEEQLWGEVFGRDLPAKAFKELGYTHLQTVLKEKAEEKLKLSEQISFAEKLKQLKISPFTNESVKKYKEAIIRSMGFHCHGIIEIIKKYCFRLFIVSILSLFLNLFSNQIILTFMADNPLLNLYNIWFKFSLIGIGVFFVSGMVSWVYFNLSNEECNLYKWRHFKLTGYDKPVPDFALDIALKIRQVEPFAEIGICELVKDKVRLNYDPFLYVNMSGKIFYLCVWDEPTFRGPRENEVEN